MATTVTSVGVVLAPAGVDAVGTLVGAVYVALFGPFDVMLPQVGLHVARFGTVIVLVGADCVTSHVTPCPCRSLLSTTLKPCGSFVGTVAVVGVSDTPIPESNTKVTLPVFFVSCCDCAVIMTFNPGNFVWSGILLGAV
jgi:hypothetical protein